MQLTCPCCHAAFPIEVALQHEDGRQVMGMLAGMQPELALPLMHYIGFFRPAKQQLGWGRALRLMREVVLLLPTPVDLLVWGLQEAARTLDDKRSQPGWKPLGNHNYLRRCLDSAQARSGSTAAGLAPAVAAAQAVAAPAVRSQSGAALVALEGMRRGKR